MNHYPLVTVIIPVYNAGEYLRPAVESIINQSYKNLEVIIVDDGSTDGCMESIYDFIFNDKRIVVLEQKNSGKSVALNKAMDVMKGEFWAIQDADDLSYRERIEKQLSILIEKKELAAVYVGHDLLLNLKRFAPTFKYSNIEECKIYINAFRMPAHDATGLYRTSMVKEFRFDPELKIGQGMDYTLKIGEKFSILLVGECLYTYRINYNSTIRRRPEQNIDYINRVIEKAVKRRNVKISNNRSYRDVEYRKKNRSKDNHIISHCMESIIDLKIAGRPAEALETGYTCFMLNPMDWYYYKPFVYSLLPVSAIRLYRNIKNRRQKSLP